MKLDLKFNKEELFLICDCLDVAKDNTTNINLIDNINILKNNIKKVIDVLEDLKECDLK